MMGFDKILTFGALARWPFEPSTGSGGEGVTGSESHIHRAIVTVTNCAQRDAVSDSYQELASVIVSLHYTACNRSWLRTALGCLLSCLR